MKNWENEINADTPLASRNLDIESINKKQIKEFKVPKQECCSIKSNIYYIKIKDKYFLPRNNE